MDPRSISTNKGTYQVMRLHHGHIGWIGRVVRNVQGPVMVRAQYRSVIREHDDSAPVAEDDRPRCALPSRRELSYWVVALTQGLNAHIHLPFVI